MRISLVCKYCGGPITSRATQCLKCWRDHELIGAGLNRVPKNTIKFWSKVDKNGPFPKEKPELGACWIWRGGKDSEGYSMYAIGNENSSLRAHRVAFLLCRGQIPDGYEPDHLCRNRGCVNPSHIEAVTQIENIRRSSVAKLNWDQVHEIRNTKCSSSIMAKKLNCSSGLIRLIRRRERWAT